MKQVGSCQLFVYELELLLCSHPKNLTGSVLNKFRDKLNVLLIISFLVQTASSTSTIHCSSSSLSTSCTTPIIPLAPPAPLYFLSPCSTSPPSEPSDKLHVVQPLGGLHAEPALLWCPPLALDRAMAHHLRHCPYHLRQLKSWLVSGREFPESLHGQPL